jgi:taurine dioxygenase
MATALRAVELPPVGGDTCWSCMYAAYEALSPAMRQMLDGLTAVHSSAATTGRLGEFLGARDASTTSFGGEVVHPVVRLHPETGRKALYVSECSTVQIVELGPTESRHMLAMLFEHMKAPEFSVRWRWSQNDVAFWDNRSVQHYAVPDYSGRRVMQRVVLAGDRPAGPR